MKKILILISSILVIISISLFDFKNDILNKVDLFLTSDEIIKFENSKMYVSEQNELIFEFVLTNNTSESLNYKLYIESIHEGAFDFVRMEVLKDGFTQYNDKLSKITSDNVFEISNVNPYETIEYKIILKATRIKFKLSGIIKASAVPVEDIPSKLTVTMPINPETERNFTWHIKNNNSGYIQIVRAKNDNKSIANFDSKDLKEYESEIELDSFSEYVHTVKVDNLKPGTEYYYRVGNKDTNTWSDVGKFKTDDGNNSFSFIYLTDMQTNSNEYSRSIYTILSALEKNENAEFILNTGDFVNTASSYEEWNGVLESDIFKSITNVAAIGNHDYEESDIGKNVFKQHFNFDTLENIDTVGAYYSFDYGNAHFIILNTNDYQWNELSETQLAWLEDDLKKSQDYDFRIVAMHRGVYTSGPHLYEYNDILVLTNQLTPIFDKYNVDLVLQGHDHTFGLTYPINEDYKKEDIEIKKVKSKETNQKISVMYKPSSPVYFINGAAGDKHYNTLELRNGLYEVSSSYEESPITLEHSDLDKIYSNFQKVDTPHIEGVKAATFSSIEIKGKTLLVNTYIVDNINFKEPELYHSFGIKK